MPITITITITLKSQSSITITITITVKKVIITITVTITITYYPMPGKQGLIFMNFSIFPFLVLLKALYLLVGETKNNKATCIIQMHLSHTGAGDFF